MADSPICYPLFLNQAKIVILFIKHIDIEGPDILENMIKDKGFDAKTIELQNGDLLPRKMSDIEAIISLGGPMSVYANDKHPFLQAEDDFTKKALADNVPFMGICLGSQILAKACGAQINQSPEKELGFLSVNIEKDPLFDGLDGKAEFFHWHEDMSNLPSGAKLIASSNGCPHQAFRMGTNAYGLQFHIEVTEETIRKWIDKYLSEDNPEHMSKKEKILKDCQARMAPLHHKADIIIDNFIKIIKS